MSKKIRDKAVPEWVRRGQKATTVYDILAAPFNIECNCETCQIVRENIELLENMFNPPAIGGKEGAK